MDDKGEIDVIEKNEDEEDIATEIGNMVSRRATQYRNSVLASQIQKAMPIVSSIEKRDSFHITLQKLSEESLLEKPQQKKVTIHIPRRSIHTLELVPLIEVMAAFERNKKSVQQKLNLFTNGRSTLEEYIIAGAKEKLLADSFVRNLPVSIKEKRECRKSISIALERKPWHIKLHNFMAKKYENFRSWFDLWHSILNTIEGRHGTAVTSYFYFIRWLLFMNIMIFFLNFTFLILPQCSLLTRAVVSNADDANSNHSMDFSFADNKTIKLNSEMDDLEWMRYSVFQLEDSFNENLTNTTSINVIIDQCQKLYMQEVENDTRTGVFATVQNFLQGTGPLERTRLFIGFYPPFNIIHDVHVYRVSLAFLCVLFATFIGCLIMMIQYSSVGIQESFKVQNTKFNFYSNEVFSAWEYCIKEPESARNQHYQFFLQMKTNLSEDRAARQFTGRSMKTWLKLYAVRFFINVFILAWLFGCCTLIYSVTVYQMRELQTHLLSDPGPRTFIIQFLSAITLVVLNSISPTLFKKLVIFEKYSSQTEMNISICRNIFIYLSSIIILLNTFYRQVACKPKDICGRGLDMSCRSPRCWETYIGQQLFKLTLTDMFVYIAVFCLNDMLKGYITRKYDNKFTRLWGYPMFFLPTEIITVVNSQTILWLGVFYSPLLPAVMIFKLTLIFYIKKTKILKCCEPSESSYRSSRFNAVFILILLISFFVVLIVQNFAIERVPPSRGCGPFRYLDSMVEAVPEFIRSWLSVLTSYWTIILTILILCLVIHYYWKTLVSQKTLAERLKAHLVLQSHDKLFLLKSIADLTDEAAVSKMKKN